MYVCICSAFNEKKVKEALDAGARSTASVFRHIGTSVQCGKCVPMVRDMVRDHCVGDCTHCPNAEEHARDAANQDIPEYVPMAAE